MSELSITIHNVGGINHYEQTFHDLVTVVTGSNASNKTSLLQALAFGLGRSTVPIRSGASEARVKLEIDGHEVVRTAESSGRGVVTSGDGLLEDQGDVELFERFACLFEFNEVRQAVREGRSVEELLKDPMDLNALEARRSDLLKQKKTLKEEVNQLSDVEEEIESRKRELSTTREQITDLEGELDELRKQQVESTADDEGTNELREKRASLVHDRKKYERQVNELEEAIERLEDGLADAEAELEDARTEAETVDLGQLRAEQEEIRENLDDIVDRVEVLQSVLTANREMLNSPYTGVLGQDSSLVEDSMVCWACGDETAVSDFQETVDELTELIERSNQRRNEYRPRLEEIEEKITDAKRAQRHVTELESRVADRKAAIENRHESLETKQESLEDIRDELRELDERLAERESEQSLEVSDTQEQIEEFRVDLHTAQSEAERLETAVDELEERLKKRKEMRAEIDRLTDEIGSLTDRIQTLEKDLREGFNNAITELIEVLDYERIERIWLDGNFDLIVAREVDSIVRQDDISSLSESEREMVGLMLALAGYLAYDVADIAPVLLLDALGAFDTERTAKLISYIADETPYLVAALLPDSATVFEAIDVGSGVVTPTRITMSH